MPCTSIGDRDFTDILILHTMHEGIMGVANCIRLYTRLFTTKNQAIKTPGKVDQAIKQASRDESNDQAPILTIKYHCRWKYRAHSSDYPLNCWTIHNFSILSINVVMNLYSIMEQYMCHARSADLDVHEERQEAFVIVCCDQWWVSWVVGAIAWLTH